MANQKQTIKIDGMSCGACVDSVRSVAAAVNGVDIVSVDFDAKQATITFDDSKTNAQVIASAINEAGFDATVFNA